MLCAYRRTRFVAIAAFLLQVTACGFKTMEAEPRRTKLPVDKQAADATATADSSDGNAKTGNVTFNLAGADPALVRKITVTVSKAGVELQKTDLTFDGTPLSIATLPEGDLDVTLDLKDAAGDVVGTGKASVHIVAGNVTETAVTIVPAATGGLTVNVNAPVTPPSMPSPAALVSLALRVQISSTGSFAANTVITDPKKAILDAYIRPIAMATYDDGSVVDVSDKAKWSFDDQTALTSTGTASLELSRLTSPLRNAPTYQALKEGNVTITGAFTDSGATLTSTVQITTGPNPDKFYSVIAPPPGSLTNVAIEPSSTGDPIPDNFRIGQRKSFRAVGIYKRGGVQTGKIDISGQVNWSTDNVAMIRVGDSVSATGAQPDSLRKGQVQALAAGGVNILISLNGTLSTFRTVHISTVAPTAITVTLTNGNCATDCRVARATGLFNDGSNIDISTEVVWSSSDPSNAQLSVLSGTDVMVYGRKQGSYTIRATFGGLSGQATYLVQ